MANKWENSEAFKRIQNKEITVDLNKIFNLQLSNEAKLTIILRVLAEMRAGKRGTNPEAEEADLVNQVNEELTLRFEELSNLWR